MMACAKGQLIALWLGGAYTLERRNRRDHWLSQSYTRSARQKQAEETLRVNETLQTFLVKLGDALRALSHSIDIQETAARVISEPAEQLTSQAPSERLLIIDTSLDAALTLSMLLKLKGHEGHSRTSGRLGLEAAESLKPAATLLDIGMPDRDGYETCRLIRQRPWSDKLRIIALTSYGQEDDQQRTREAGGNTHVVKPVERAGLTQLLMKLLND